MAHTLCEQCASPATETSGLCWPCSERKRLKAINAELLAALKAARKTMALALDNMPWLTQRIIGTSVTELTPEAQAWCDTLNAAAKEARAAIEKAEAE